MSTPSDDPWEKAFERAKSGTSDPEARARQEQSDEVAMTREARSPGRRVKTPALALITLALLGTAFNCVFNLVAGPAFQRARNVELPMDGAAADGARAAPLLGFCITLPATVLMLCGGVAMHSLSHRWLAQLGAVAAMLPCSFTCLPGIFIGWWVLQALNDPIVRAEFDRPTVAG
jgi:hypothetical protein